MSLAVSLFDDLYEAAAVPALMDVLGEPAGVTITPAGGAPVTVTGIVGYEETEEDETLDGRTQRRVREVTVTTDPDSDYGGWSSPAITATVTIDGVEYAVREIVSVSPALVTLGLQRRGAIEVSREHYRRKP